MSKKQKSSPKAKAKQLPEKTGLKATFEKLGQRLGQLEKKEFWHSHLPWPKFLRKPRIRFSLPRINRTFPIPNRTVMFVLALILVGFSIAGGAYDIISTTTGRMAVGYTGGENPQAIFFYTGMHDQFFLEGIIAFALISMGFIGFLFIHQSTKHFYRPKYSYMLFSVGIALIFMAFIFMNLIVTGEDGKDITMYSPWR